jgi:hypothetical protein
VRVTSRQLSQTDESRGSRHHLTLHPTIEVGGNSVVLNYVKRCALEDRAQGSSFINLVITLQACGQGRREFSCLLTILQADLIHHQEHVFGTRNMDGG